MNALYLIDPPSDLGIESVNIRHITLKSPYLGHNGLRLGEEVVA